MIEVFLTLISCGINSNQGISLFLNKLNSDTGMWTLFILLGDMYLMNVYTPLCEMIFYVLFQAFRTSDGYILVGTGNDSQFKVLGQVSVHDIKAVKDFFFQRRKQLLHQCNCYFLEE